MWMKLMITGKFNFYYKLLLEYFFVIMLLLFCYLFFQSLYFEYREIHNVILFKKISEINFY